MARNSPQDPASEKKLVDEAAEHMMTRFGNCALTEVNRRVAELEQRGETESRDFWRKVRDAVTLLRKQSEGQ